MNGLPSGTAFSYNNPKQHIREDFGTLRSDYIVSNRDTLSTAYTIDDGNSLIPMADPLFGTPSALRMQVASVEETHIFSPEYPEYVSRRILAGGIRSRLVRLRHIAARTFFCKRRGARRHRRQRRA